MADENVKNLDTDVINQDEYEKALEVLSTSRRKRVKGIVETKKMKKEQEKKDENSFDPVIPICLILAAVALIGAVLYFILPVAVNPAMSFTYKDFVQKYENTSTYQVMLSKFDMDISEIKYIIGDQDDNGFKLTDSNSYLDSFSCVINKDLGAAIQGQSRKFDSKLTLLRAVVKYGDKNTSTNLMCSYYSAILCALYPDLTSDAAYEEIANMLKSFNGSGEYTVKGDYAYRILLGTNSSKEDKYFAFEVVPSRTVK